jgi:hypothetical protein
MSATTITVNKPTGTVVIQGSGPTQTVNLTTGETQVVQLGSLSAAVNQQITQAVASTTASAATATDAAATATSEAAVATAAAGTATAEAEAAAASATASANAYSAIANGTAPDAGPIQGNEKFTLSRGNGVLQASPSEIKSFISPIASQTEAGITLPQQYLTVDIKGNVAVDPNFIARVVQNEAKLCAYRADFINGVYGIGPAEGVLSDVVTQSAANLDASGRLLVQRGTTNLISNAALAGAVVGLYNAGGVLPTGMQLSDPALLWQVISTASGTVRIRVFRSSGNPVGSSFGIRIPVTLSSAPTRGGIVGSATMGVVSATSNITNVVLQVNNNTTGLSGISPPMPVTGGLTAVSGFVAASNGDSLYHRIEFSLSGDPTANFDATFDYQYPQLEDGSSALDYTAFVAGTRAAYTTTLAIPQGSYSVCMQTSTYGTWQQVTVPDGNGWTVPAPSVGMLAIQNVYGLLPAYGTARETEFSTIMFPPQFAMTYPVGGGFIANGFTWGIQGNPAAAYAYENALNKSSLQRFEVHQGDQASFDAGHAVDRCEAVATTSFPYGSDVWVSVAIMVEPGTPVYDAADQFAWCSLIQMHGNPQPGDERYSQKLSWSPCFTLDIIGDVLNIQTRSETDVYPSGNPIEMIRYADSNFQRGVFNYYVFHMVFQQTGNGLLQMWRNGNQILNLTIPIGYNDALGPYMKYGIYRGTDPVVTAVQFANLEVSGSSLLSRVANPLPVA